MYTEVKSIWSNKVFGVLPELAAGMPLPLELLLLGLRNLDFPSTFTSM
jgi:hypothetical protein